MWFILSQHNMHSNILVYSRLRLYCCLCAGARSGRGFPFVKICYQNQPRIQPARHSLCAGSGVVARAQGFSPCYVQIRNTILMAFTLFRRINKLSSPEPWEACPCTSCLHLHQHWHKFIISDDSLDNWLKIMILNL